MPRCDYAHIHRPFLALVVSVLQSPSPRQRSRKEKHYTGWKRNNKNSFIEYLICPGNLASFLTYLDSQSPVIYQAKAILLINDNTGTQMQGLFGLFVLLISKLVLSTSMLQ